MKTFHLPDLGEGLPDAEIREWYVTPGDTLVIDQPIAAVETAKSVVEIPAPFAGTVTALHGQPGDTIATGQPLLSADALSDNPAEKNSDTAIAAEISAIQDTSINHASATQPDQGTVVGALQTSDQLLDEPAMGLTKISNTEPNSPTVKPGYKSTPAVRALAKKLNVDLATIQLDDPERSVIRLEDVKAAAKNQPNQTISSFAEPAHESAPKGFQSLSGARRSMAQIMTQLQTEVALATVVDNADIHAWADNQDITLRLIQATVAACAAEPALNAHFHSASNAIKQHAQVNLGLALDTGRALYVPVLQSVNNQAPPTTRTHIERFKQAAQADHFAPEDLKDATIILSNFGRFAGRYATPMVVPPMVAIIAAGRLYDTVVADQGQAIVHKQIPLSISFDHRAVTGGEAARFLAAMLAHLAQAEA